MTMQGSVIERDKLVDNLLERIEELERRLAQVERVAAGALAVVETGTEGASELAWAQVEVAGVSGYVRVYGSK